MPLRYYYRLLNTPIINNQNSPPEQLFKITSRGQRCMEIIIWSEPTIIGPGRRDIVYGLLITNFHTSRTVVFVSTDAANEDEKESFLIFCSN